MKGDTIFTRRILLAATLCFCTSLAQAAIIYLPGNTVDFYYDDAQPGMAAYGALSVVGDSIFATPTAFLAESLGSVGGDVDVFSSLGTITVVAKAGYKFDAVAVVQEGDYIVDGAGASVSVASDLMVVDSNNAGTNEMLMMVNSGLGVNDGLLQAWSSSGQFDLSTAPWTNVGSIDLSLSNILTATTSGIGEHALIQNKFVGGGLLTIETVVVPVPASAWLFISGLFGLVGFSRRKAK